jgi:4-hydroxy-2-oxoheptanedioate aldolase
MPFKLNSNRIKEAMREGRTAFGIYIETPSAAMVELAGLAGLDFVRLDWSHAPFDSSMIENMIRAAENQDITPFIRLDFDEQKITSVLEMGAMGIIIPDVSTAEKAKEVVNAAKFSPIGRRGMFSVSRKCGYGSMDSAYYKKWSNEEIMVGIQIESLEALEDLDEILSVQGIDVVLSGRGDLANALGVPGQKNHPLVLEAEGRIFSAAKAEGIAISPQLDPNAVNFASDVQKWVGDGAEIISLGMDLSIIKRAFEDIMNKIKNSNKQNI